MRDTKGHTEGQSLVSRSSPARISFQRSWDHPLLSGVGETGLGNYSLVLPIPIPFLRELGAALQTVFPFQHEQVGSLELEKEAGGGVGHGSWQASLAACEGGSFPGAPSLPFSFLSGSADPQGTQALALPECPFKRKGV